MAPKTESLMATEPEPQASVPENCQVVPEGFRKARGGQRPPEEALCTRLLKKGAGQDTTLSGGKRLRPGLRWIYSPRGLKSVLGQAKGRGKEPGMMQAREENLQNQPVGQRLSQG